jgi:putative endonuclease
MKSYYIYILGNDRPTLYIGITNNLIRRLHEHKNGLIPRFTKRYCLKKLLYFEMFTQINEALAREKQLKQWEREWKLILISKSNPKFEDLYNSLIK